MSLADRLARIVSEMPEEGAVTLPVSWIRELLGEGDEDDRIADLTVEEVAEELGRAPSTVRGWLSSGRLRGYRFRGREWRVTRATVAEFVANERDRTGRNELAPGRSADLGSWRREYREEGAA